MNDSTLGKIVGGWQVSAPHRRPVRPGPDNRRQRARPSTRRAMHRRFRQPDRRQQSIGGSDPDSFVSKSRVYSSVKSKLEAPLRPRMAQGFWRLKISMLFKRFRLGGSRYGELAVDTYNVTNSVRWADPNVTFSTATGRRVQPNHRHERQPAQRQVRHTVPPSRAAESLRSGPRTNAERRGNVWPNFQGRGGTQKTRAPIACLQGRGRTRRDAERITCFQGRQTHGEKRGEQSLVSRAEEHTARRGGSAGREDTRRPSACQALRGHRVLT